ncbi:hypothetical protein Acr_28g0009780 [Actinidia rufa]|uniref:Uncharacterized protein n=1 Tax=Actinidia rufa TaxID=165716 RepID=A0A7J0HB01_9ERIC|nr:hypothetical protein Acr_28g0009780 [Actinidia rufa]
MNPQAFPAELGDGKGNKTVCVMVVGGQQRGEWARLQRKGGGVSVEVGQSWISTVAGGGRRWGRRKKGLILGAGGCLAAGLEIMRGIEGPKEKGLGCSLGSERLGMLSSCLETMRGIEGPKEKGLGCSLGSERRETVRSIPGVGVRALRGSFPSTILKTLPGSNFETVDS